ACPPVRQECVVLVVVSTQDDAVLVSVLGCPIAHLFGNAGVSGGGVQVAAGGVWRVQENAGDGVAGGGSQYGRGGDAGPVTACNPHSGEPVGERPHPSGQLLPHVVTEVRQRPVDAPPSVAEVRQLAVDTLPGVTEVRQLAVDT